MIKVVQLSRNKERALIEDTNIGWQWHEFLRLLVSTALVPFEQIKRSSCLIENATDPIVQDDQCEAIAGTQSCGHRVRLARSGGR